MFFLYGANVVKLYVSPNEGIGGSKCLVIHGLTPRGRREWFQRVSSGLPLGGEVTLTAYIKTTKVAESAWIEIRVLKGSRIISYASTRDSSDARGNTDWTRYSISVRVPREATSIDVSAVLKGRGKAYFDNFKLVPTHGGGETSKPGSGGNKTLFSAKKGGKGSNAVFLVRISLDAIAKREEKGGKVYVSLPAVTETQYPFYFKFESMPADGIRKMKIIYKGGRSSPPLMECTLMPLRTGEKVRMDLETKILAVTSFREKKIPGTLQGALKFPSKLKAYAKPSGLLKKYREQGNKVIAYLKRETDLETGLLALAGACDKFDPPQYVMAYALRSIGLPCRLVSGIRTNKAGPTNPGLACQVWIPRAGWVTILSKPPVVFSPAVEFLVFRPIPRTEEKGYSNTFPGLPRFSFIERKGNLELKGARDPKADLFVTCSKVLPLKEIPLSIRKKLLEALSENWNTWIRAREKGKGDQEAEFAGQAASQTNDYEEMLRMLTEK